MKNLFCIGLVSLAFTILPTPYVSAQDSELPACFTTASDADGDGFGWEWSRVETRYVSCAVTDQSETAPMAVDEFGGFTGELETRAYWNANRDIAGRTIACDSLFFSRESQALEVIDVFEFQHDPLPLVAPFIAFADFSGTSDWSNLSENVSRQRSSNVWTVRDGIYQGPMLLSPWVQIVDRGGRSNNAIRYRRGFGIFECYDPTGEPFVPTGFFDEVLPEPQQQAELPTITSTGVNDANGLSDVDPLINLQTGNEVVLPPITWDLFNDMIGREITCDRFTWDDSLQGYFAFEGVQATEFFIFYPISLSGPQKHGLVVTLQNRQNSFLTNYEFRIIDGEVMPDDVPIFSADNVEIINNTSIRIWDSSNFYTACRDTGKVVGVGLVDATDVKALIPTGVVQLGPNTATDSTNDSIDETIGVANGVEDAGTTDVQTSQDTTDNSSDDSTGNSSDTTTADNENTAVEDEVVASNTQTESTSTDLVSSDETASPSSGGGSIWLPILMFALAFRRPIRAL